MPTQICKQIAILRHTYQNKIDPWGNRTLTAPASRIYQRRVGTEGRNNCFRIAKVHRSTSSRSNDWPDWAHPSSDSRSYPRRYKWYHPNIVLQSHTRYPSPSDIRVCISILHRRMTYRRIWASFPSYSLVMDRSSTSFRDIPCQIR